MEDRGRKLQSESIELRSTIAHLEGSSREAVIRAVSAAEADAESRHAAAISRITHSYDERFASELQAARTSSSAPQPPLACAVCPIKDARIASM